MKNIFGSPLFRNWLAVVGTATLVLGAAYAMAQQSTRLSADDLPRSTAQSVRQQLQTQSSPKDVIPSPKVDLRGGDGVFVIITDDTEHIIASSAVLDGQTPLPPKGVFSFTEQHATDHFTWEPSPGVRLATRVIKYKSGNDGGFIIAGQSLQPYENRVTTYTWIALAAWLAVLAWTYLTMILPSWRASSR